MNQTPQIQKVTAAVVYKENMSSFSVIGDPGCEGLGTSMMRVYANALQASAEDDFILVAGDLVPVGTQKHYQTVCDLTNAIAQKEVYVLRGNHDTGAYGDYFGRQDYALVGRDFSVVVMDNAKRSFSEEGLRILGDVLAMEECRRVVVAFHIPLPNHFTGNAVPQAEFARLREVYLPFREKVKYFVCGHVHSRFSDVVDGIPFLCTGGGGAMIEDVSEEIKAEDVEHHIIRFSFEDGALAHRFVELDTTPYQRELQNPILREKLSEAVKGELLAHLRYLSFAQRAEKRGFARLGNLFRALAESEYRHARNFFSILEEPEPFSSTIQSFIPEEEFEYQRLYQMMGDYAEEGNLPLSRQAYEDAAAAEKIHAKLLKKAQRLEKEEPAGVYVCSICGFVMEQGEEPDRCPVCGAPAKQFLLFEAKEKD